MANMSRRASLASDPGCYSGKASLLALPTEILRHIYAYLEWHPFDVELLTPTKISQEWLDSRLVCKQLNQVMSPNVFRTMNIALRWHDNVLRTPKAFHLRRAVPRLDEYVQDVNIEGLLDEDPPEGSSDSAFMFPEASHHDPSQLLGSEPQYDDFYRRAYDGLTDIFKHAARGIECHEISLAEHRGHRGTLHRVIQGVLDRQTARVEKADSGCDACSETVKYPLEERLHLQALAFVLYVLPPTRIRTLTVRIAVKLKGCRSMFQTMNQLHTARLKVTFTSYLFGLLPRLYGPQGLEHLALDISPIQNMRLLWMRRDFSFLDHLTTLALPALDDKPDTSGALTQRHLDVQIVESMTMSCTSLRHLIIRDTTLTFYSLGLVLKPLIQAGKLRKLTLRSLLFSVLPQFRVMSPFDAAWPRFGNVHTKDHSISLTILSGLLSLRREFPRNFEFRVMDLQWSGGPNSISSEATEWLLRETDQRLEQKLLREGHNVEFINEERQLLNEDFYRVLKNLHPQGDVRS